MIQLLKSDYNSLSLKKFCDHLNFKFETHLSVSYSYTDIFAITSMFFVACICVSVCLLVGRCRCISVCRGYNGIQDFASRLCAVHFLCNHWVPYRRDTAHNWIKFLPQFLSIFVYGKALYLNPALRFRLVWLAALHWSSPNSVTRVCRWQAASMPDCILNRF